MTVHQQPIDKTCILIIINTKAIILHLQNTSFSGITIAQIKNSINSPMHHTGFSPKLNTRKHSMNKFCQFYTAVYVTPTYFSKTFLSYKNPINYFSKRFRIEMNDSLKIHPKTTLFLLTMLKIQSLQKQFIRDRT